ncbi:MAG: hypothetical protein ACSLFH_14320 [Desulfuromonadales bacterium]
MSPQAAPINAAEEAPDPLGWDLQQDLDVIAEFVIFSRFITFIVILITILA